MQEGGHGLTVSRRERRFLVTVICSSTGVQTTIVCWRIHYDGVTVLHFDKGYMFHKGSNALKKIGAWIQKDLRV